MNKRPLHIIQNSRGGLLAALFLASAGGGFAGVHYVDLNSTNATAPYTNWATAATNIQDAVVAAVVGDEVVVTNGTYHPVAVHTSLRLQSVNGPQFTAIDGAGSGQCVYLNNGASLSGFTVTNGSRGVLAESWTATVSNCVISGNVSYGWGGGAYGCTLNDCTLSSNWAFFHGGGAAYCALNNCRLAGNTTDDDFDFDVSFSPEGGGAYYCTLNNCTLTGNSATRWVSEFNSQAAYGGGASSCTLNNCSLTGNYAFATDLSGAGNGVVAYGGGASGSTLNNCTLLGNWAAIYQTNRLTGNGVSACRMEYCIVGDAYDYSSTLDHCGTTNPLFVDYAAGNLRLQSNSPCINAGNNAFAPASLDLDGNPRIVGGTVDIGAYEYQSLSLINFSVDSNRAGFNITGQSNQVILVEASSDLATWLPLATNTLSGHPFPFTDPTAETQARPFYRAQAQ